MTLRRIRARRDTPVSGALDYVLFDDRGAPVQSGSAHLGDASIAGECELVIAADLVLLDSVKVPAAQRARLSTRLRFLTEDGTVSEPDALHVAAAPEGEPGLLRLAVVDREWLAQLIARLNGSALVPQRAYPESLLVPLPPGGWVVVWNGIDSFVRTDPLQGFSLDQPEGDEPPATLRLALDKAREQDQAPQRILVRPTQGRGQLPDLQHWSRTLGVAVEAGPPWQWSEPAARPQLDLLQGEFASRGGERGWQGKLRRLAALAAVVVLAASAGLASDWVAKARERRALLSEMQSLYRETFGERAVIIDPALQMAKALDDLRARAGQPSSTDFLALLGAVSDPAAGLAGQPMEALSYEKGKLTLSLRGSDAGKVSELLRELRAKGELPGIQIGTEASGPRTLLTVRASGYR